MPETALEYKLLNLDALDLEENLSVDGGLEDSLLDHPVQKLFQQGALAKFDGGDWDEQISAAPLAKRAEETDPRRLWKTITRTERVTDEDGGVWSRGFNAVGELVDARLLIGAE